MKRDILTKVLLFATILLLAVNLIRFSGSVHAQQPKTIPGSWGSLRSASSQLLYLEDQFGTIRVYDVAQQRLIDEIRRN